MDARFADILDGLRQLRESTKRSNVFGADAHGFRTNPPLSEAEVRAFEVRHGIVLPADYRGFFINVGNGGAGPSYGLFPLGMEDGGTSEGCRYWTEGDGFVGILSKPFPHSRPWNDLAGMPEYDEAREDDQEWEDEYSRRMDAWEQVYWNSANVNGAIPVCHLGCAYRQWLVVSGAETGFIWNDDRADNTGLKPLQHGGKTRINFMDWYRTWLDEALLQMS